MKRAKSIVVLVIIILISQLISVDLVCSRSLNIAPEGKIKGLILDAHQARVPNAVIILKSRRVQRKVKSNEVGEFEVVLPAGVYQINVDAHSLGFSLFQEKGISVRSNSTQEFHITLGSIVPVIVD